jgi:hypothetical protein
LVDELRIPRCWYQLANKGLVRNAHGRWVKPKRDAEDIPSPAGREESTVNAIAVGMQAQDAVESALYALVLL